LYTATQKLGPISGLTRVDLYLEKNLHFLSAVTIKLHTDIQKTEIKKSQKNMWLICK
jgi:hypothetical protein